MSTTPAHDTDLSVLSTINADGSRRWIKPRPSRGRFWNRRRALGYALIALFTLIPYLRIAGRPMVQLDIGRRVFSLFGAVFFPTDTLILALLVVSFFLSIFLLTALFGRVWCGWGCPQTVYMEFLFRPIERLFEGEPGKKRRTAAWRKPAKWATYLILCVYLAHTFLAYFVGVDQLKVWITRSPFEHPAPFLVMAVTTALMMFDFCFFREQTCLVACPYGRFQSVLLDRNSLIVTYDPGRGEPRGRKKRKPAGDVSLAVVEAPPQGDCIDCHKCVTTCPTGIDIRDGLQMECVHCTQCIDACDDVMDKIGRPRGLIRYSSQARIEGEKQKFLRPRVLIYPLLLALMLAGLGMVLGARQAAEVTVIRSRGGLPYFRVVEPTGDQIGTRLSVRIRNRTDKPVDYAFALDDLPGGVISRAEGPVHIEPFGLATAEMVLLLPPQAYDEHGRREVALTVTGSDGFSTQVRYGLIGPAWLGRDRKKDEHGGEPDADRADHADEAEDPGS